jgi:hypothetical protein
LLWKYKKLTEPVVVIAAALFGLVLYPMFRWVVLETSLKKLTLLVADLI